MKKIILLFACCSFAVFLPCGYAQQQNLLTEAQQLTTLYDSLRYKELVQKLIRYMPPHMHTDTLKLSEIATYFQHNPYLSDLFSEIHRVSEKLHYQATLEFQKKLNELQRYHSRLDSLRKELKQTTANLTKTATDSSLKFLLLEKAKEKQNGRNNQRMDSLVLEKQINRTSHVVNRREEQRPENGEKLNETKIKNTTYIKRLQTLDSLQKVIMGAISELETDSTQKQRLLRNDEHYLNGVRGAIRAANTLSDSTLTQRSANLYLLSNSGFSPKDSDFPAITPSSNVSYRGNSSLESDLILGTAYFLEERLKEEVNVAFIEKLKKEFQSEQYTEFKILFPNTFQLLNAIQSYQYSNILRLLQAAFYRDINNLLPNLGKLGKETKYNHSGHHFMYLMAFIQALDMMHQGIHPQEIIANFEKKHGSLLSPEMASSLRTIRVVSDALRNTGVSQNGWISITSFNNQMENNKNSKKFRLFFLGVLYEQLYNISDSLSIDLENLEETLYGFFKLAASIDLNLKELQAPKESDLHKQLLQNYYQSAFQLLKFSVVELSSYPDSTKQKMVRLTKALETANRALIQQNYADLLISIQRMIALAEVHFPHQDKFLQYSSFMVSVINAKNEEQVKEAIKTIALPAGSYSIKRKSYFNVSLNSFVGLTNGVELAYTYKPEDNISSYNFGFTAPIGIAVSWANKRKITKCRSTAFRKGAQYRFQNNPYTDVYKTRKSASSDADSSIHHKKYFKGSSSSIYFSLVDLGALVLYRLEGSDDPLPQDPDLVQVFAPGIFYVRGLRNSPLAYFIGAQVSPQLRTVEKIERNALRFNVGLTIDIPILNFHSRTDPATSWSKEQKKRTYKTQKTNT